MKHFLENCLPKDSKNSLNILNNGNKIIAMKFRKLTLIDSHSFITTNLASFSKTYDIVELKKGFFPHLFNILQNFNYIGHYPDIKYYQPDLMSNEKRTEFFNWYEQVKNDLFDFNFELTEYCWSDVRLLTEGCLKFRRLNMLSTKRNELDEGIDPFVSSFTIASYCNLIFRRNFMQKNSIGIIPEHGYNPKQNVSKKADKWLKYLEKTLSIRIKTNYNGSEEKCGEYFLDGINHENKIIFEFHGCFWHGCLHCYSDSTFNPIKQQTMKQINFKHNNRIKFIKSRYSSYKLIEIWEHDYDKLSKTQEFEFFLKNNNLNNNNELEIRNCLYGGRTNAIKLYHECNENEKISYIDVTSLYPFVQKYCRYPKGHPQIYYNIDLNYFMDLLNNNYKYFGMIKCSILPPKDLFLPILPVRLHNKLIFPLCLKCAELIQTNCNHNENERLLNGEWCLEEVYLAIEYGYKIKSIFEIWHWNETEKYDPITKTGGLFTGYINQAMKEKQEASGYPEDCITDIEKENYIQDFYNAEGILLDKNK
jgi:G:T-mismatch repair DNA endonuclease (very short patch repair protein)